MEKSKGLFSLWRSCLQLNEHVPECRELERVPVMVRAVRSIDRKFIDQGRSLK
jgi:hypothetical protein